MNDILNSIVERKKYNLELQKQRLKIEALQDIVVNSNFKENEDFKFFNELKKKQPSIISEIKRASPSKGMLKDKLDPILLAQEYLKGGASALSILTEENFFAGSIKDLISVKEAVKLPILRKDFIFDEYQIWESKFIGANAILLIAAILSDSQLKKFNTLANDLKLNILFEVHDEEEAERILSLNPKIIGVNNRNLKTFTVSLETSKRIISKYKKPDSKELWVSESGIETKQNIEELVSCGFNSFLIGETLIKSENPAKKIQELLN